MPKARTDPDSTGGHMPAVDAGVAARRARAGWPLLVAVLVGFLLLAGAAVAIVVLRGDTGPGSDAAFQPDGARLGPVSGAEEAPLPDGTLSAIDSDDEIAVRDYVGQPLVVNFWASWCAPCVEEMPAIQQVADELAGRVTVLGINTLDSAAKARGFAADLGVTFELAQDPTGIYFAAVGGFGWPTTLLVDDDGVIRYRHTGPLDANQLRDLLETHLAVDVS